MTPAGPATAPRDRPRRRSAPRSRAAGLRARHALSQNFLADADVLDAILAEAAPAPGRRVLEIGPGLGLLTGGAADARRRRSRPSSSIAAWRRSCASGSTERRRSLRLIEGDALDQDLVDLVEPPYDVVANLPYHITSPILHALLGRAAAAGAARADGPARGRRADRGAAREDELPVGLRAVPRAGPDRVPRPGRRAFEPEPAVESAVIVVEPYDADDRLDPDDGGRAVAARPGRASASAAR